MRDLGVPQTKGAILQIALSREKLNLMMGFLMLLRCFSVLDVQAFERLLGPCVDIMKRNINEYERELERLFGSKTKISDLR